MKESNTGKIENNTGRIATALRALKVSKGDADYASKILDLYDYAVQHEGKSHREARGLCEQAIKRGVKFMDQVKLANRDQEGAK